MHVTKDSFQFDGGDDIRAKATLDGEEFEFKVSSHALSFASPVWRKFIHPPFPLIREENQESQESPTSSSEITNLPKKKKSIYPDFDHILDFTEDRIDALLILLQIAHVQFGNIPNSLPYETLHGVAVLCDQYDCKKLVKPWLKDWLKEEWNESNLRGHEGWLFIAWCFGRHEIFSCLLTNCVLQANTLLNDNCMIDGGLLIKGVWGLGPGRRLKIYHPYSPERDGMMLPLNILENLQDARHKTIEQILIGVYGLIEEHEGEHRYCDRRKFGNTFACTAIIHGFLVRGLREKKLWPRVQPSDIRMSIHSLVRILYRIDDILFGELPKCLPSGHAECILSCRLKAVITPALSNIPALFSESHKQYMDTAKLELGLLELD